MFENGEHRQVTSSDNSGDWLLTILLTGIFMIPVWLAWQVIKGIFVLLLSTFAWLIGDSPEK